MAASSGPDIVDSGLVLALDAADRNSFDSNENLLFQTSQIGLTPTYSVSGIVGLNTTATTAPNGLFEASLLDNNGNTATNYVFGGSGISLVANTTYTYSIHIKQGTKPDFWITIDENGFGGKRYYSYFTYSTETVTTGVTGNTGNDGVLVGSSATKLTNGWYRLSLTFRTSTTSVSGFVDMINRFGNSGSNYVWGRQLEYGSSASPYYATTGGIKTRGSTLIDLTGRDNTGTLTNGPTYSSANGGSLVFDGTNDCLVVNSNASILSSTSYTKIAWFYPTSFATGNNIISGGNSGQHAFWLAGGTNLFSGHNGNWGTVASTTTLSLNTWYCGAVTFSSTTGWVLYLNGVQEDTDISTTTFTGNGEILIGAYSTGANVFTGRISNCLVYNRVLTATEIQQNFNSVRSRFGI
jgi:hypothetical protein